MIGPFDGEQLFGFLGCGIKRLTVPIGDDAIVCAMDNQGREVVSLANILLIGKFFVGKDLNWNSHSKGADEGTF